jgi:AraC family transcriptional activator of pobA
MEQYDLHKNDFSKLHFELNHLKSFFLKNKEKASKIHSHSFFQLIYFKYSGNHYIDYELIKHPANTLFFINKNQPHYFCTESINEGYLFHFNDSFLSNFNIDLLSRFTISIFSELSKPYIVFTNSESLIFENFCKIIFLELDKKNENHTQIITHQFIGLLYFIERIKNEQISFNSDMGSDFLIIIKFKQEIIKNMTQPISVAYFANLIGVSAKKLTTLTKLYTSLTPGSLIKETKILVAKRMLLNHDVSIKEIAYSLGFDQPTYFTKFFKKETKITPKEFRKQVL